MPIYENVKSADTDIHIGSLSADIISRYFIGLFSNENRVENNQCKNTLTDKRFYKAESRILATFVMASLFIAVCLDLALPKWV